MDINRNQWFMLGLIIIFLGLQFRLVDSFVLTPEFTEILAEKTGHPVAMAGDGLGAGLQAGLIPPKTVRPPEWIGWALLSLGSVLALHSLSMRKPE